MTNAPGTNEGFVVLPEIVCRAIPEPGATAAPESCHEDFRILTSTELIALVQSRNGALSHVDLPAIMSIAQERLSTSQADMHVAGQLLDACRKLADEAF